MTSEPVIHTITVSGTRQRASKAQEYFRDLIQQRISEKGEDYDLRDLFGKDLRFCIPAYYSFVKISPYIQNALKELNLISYRSCTLPILQETNIKGYQRLNVDSYVESNLTRSVIKIPKGTNYQSKTYHNNTYLRVLKIQREQKRITFHSYKGDNKIEVNLREPSGEAFLNQVTVYQEASHSLSVGDIVEFHSGTGVQGHCKVTNIDGESLSILTPKEETLTYDINDFTIRHLSLAYMKVGDPGEQTYNKTIAFYSENDTGTNIAEYEATLVKTTTEELTRFAIGKTTRKAIQITTTSDMFGHYEDYVDESPHTRKSHMEGLIDRFLATKANDISHAPAATYFLPYDSPPNSKSYTIWIGEEHYEDIRTWCMNNGKIRVNRLMYHLLVKDLVDNGVIQII